MREAWPNAAAVWGNYVVMRGALTELERVIQEGTTRLAAELVEHFKFKTITEMLDELVVHRRELDRSVTFRLLAAYEAAIRTDFKQRCDRQVGKRQKALRTALVELRRASPRRVRLDDILDVWDEHLAVERDIVGQFKQLLGPRHWLAHGRYWQPPPEAFLDPARAKLRGDTLLAAMAAHS